MIITSCFLSAPIFGCKLHAVVFSARPPLAADLHAVERADSAYWSFYVQDDNISYYGWAAWETVEDLVAYIKSDTAKKLIEYTAKEDIVTLLTGVKPIV